jgi:hypothetical protein
MNSASLKLLVVTSLIVSVALSRVLPHPPNFTPIAAIALFGAARFERKWLAFIVPALSMFISDAIIGFHSQMWVIYGTFALITLLGMVFLKNVTFSKVIVLSLVSSVLFFATTNFVVWYGSAFYPQTWQGLVSCYVAGLAFYQTNLFGNFFFNTVLGDLFFCGLLFGAYSLLQNLIPRLRFA